MSFQNKIIGAILVLIGIYGVVIIIPTFSTTSMDIIMINLGLAIGLIVIGIVAFTHKKRIKLTGKK